MRAEALVALTAKALLADKPTALLAVEPPAPFCIEVIRITYEAERRPIPVTLHEPSFFERINSSVERTTGSMLSKERKRISTVILAPSGDATGSPSRINASIDIVQVSGLP
jgi:hypothetical protein